MKSISDAKGIDGELNNIVYSRSKSETRLPRESGKSPKGKRSKGKSPKEKDRKAKSRKIKIPNVQNLEKSKSRKFKISNVQNLEKNLESKKISKCKISKVQNAEVCTVAEQNLTPHFQYFTLVVDLFN